MSNLIKKVYQCEMEKGVAQIVNALIWATVMIVSSWLMRGSENADTLFFMLLAGATSTMFLINDMGKKAQ